MSALERLKSLLGTASSQPIGRSWAVDNSIDQEITRLQRHLKAGALSYLPRDLQVEAVQRFWVSRELGSLTDARLVSYGVTLPIGPQRVCVIEDRERFPILLREVDQILPARKHYRRCYQGLLSGYFTYDPHSKEAPQIGRENWAALRTYLHDRSGMVVDGDRNPGWVDTLQSHRQVLSQEPCNRYGTAFLDGDSRVVDELREGLSIADASWFTRELFLAQIRAAERRSDAGFLKVIEHLLDMLRNNEAVRDEGLAMLLNRHAAVQPAPLSVPLRDVAVEWWGNPWLASNSMRWSRVTSASRAMVTEWLKLEFIEAFFTLLAEERTGDTRRLEFWKRYVNAIDEIHFALGTEARTSRASDFVALRRKMAGLVVDLQDNVRSNNAFIMKMGPLVIVEFSGYSNACYGYDGRKPLPFRLDRPVVMPRNAINSLKHSAHWVWLQHQDGIHGWNRWEEMFTATLATEFSIQPKKTGAAQTHLREPVAGTHEKDPLRAQKEPSTRRHEAYPGSGSDTIDAWKSRNYTRVMLSKFTERFGLKINDLTANNGNLWVQTDATNLDVNQVLHRWGFRYKDNKGWWKQG